MQLVGVRELKNRLTHYLDVAKSGDNVVVTDRGKPVAILHSLASVEEDAGVEERLAALAAQGQVSLPRRKGVFVEIGRLKVTEGEPISASLLKDRR
jgi:prevent-host-death family protein